MDVGPLPPAVELAAALARAPWAHLADERQLHVFLGTSVGLMLLWTVRAETPMGLGYHYLGATLLTLMFGWRLALAAATLVLLAAAANGAITWAALPVNALTLAALPVAVSHAIYRLAERRLPPNYFVYVFVCGYLGAAAAFVASALAACALLALGERRTGRRRPAPVPAGAPHGLPRGLHHRLAHRAHGLPAGVGADVRDERYLKGR